MQSALFEQLFKQASIGLSKTRRCGAYCILLLLCLACYHHALCGSFVFDDQVAIVKNQDVNTLPTNLSAIYSHDFWGAPLRNKESHKSFRPLTTLMFHFEYAHFRMQSKHMKLLNLILHCLNTTLLWEFLTSDGMQLIGMQWESTAIAAALFAVHPIHTEAVCGIVGRADLMFCFCYLLALLLVEFRRRTRYGVLMVDFTIICLAFVGLQFKETAIVILPACIFLDYIQKELQFEKTFWHRLHCVVFSWRNICYILMTLLMLLWRLSLQTFESPHFKPMDNPIAFSSNLWIRIASQNYLYALNCWLLLCPQWLSFDWALDCVELLKSFKDIRIVGILLMYSLMLGMLWRQRSNAVFILGFGLLIIPFLPASGIIKVGFVIAERILYVPSIGYCLLVAHSIAHLKCIFKGSNITFVHRSLLMLVFLCFILRTRERASEWLTEEKLFTSALAVCPMNAKVHYNIARLATDKLDYEKAFHHYHKSILLYPQYEAALMNLGNLYRDKGNLNAAEKYIKEALEVMPDFAAAWMNLGIVQTALKQYNKALQSYQRSLNLRPRYAICHYNLGNLYLELKKYTDAMHQWQEAIALNPKQPKAWANLLTLLDNRGMLEDAARLSATALKHLPLDNSLMFIRANVFGKLEHYIEAEHLYKRIIEMEPRNVLYHTNLGVLYHRWGKVNSAIESYRQALKLEPQKSKTAQENLSKLMRRLQKESAAHA